VNSTVKTVAFWLVIGLSALLLWQVIQAGRSGQKDKEINFPSSRATWIRGRCMKSSSTACNCTGNIATAPLSIQRCRRTIRR